MKTAGTQVKNRPVSPARFASFQSCDRRLRPQTQSPILNCMSEAINATAPSALGGSVEQPKNLVLSRVVTHVFLDGVTGLGEVE